MEMGAGDAGSWTLMSCEIVYGGCDGELAEVHHRPAQKQEQWKPGLGENQAYRRDEDRSDVGRMENGTNHLTPPLPTKSFL